MNEITAFNKNNVKDIREILNVALDNFKKLGVTSNLGTIRFEQGELRVKLTMSLPRIQESKKIALATAYGVPKIGDKYLIKSTIYTIVDYKPSRPKFPLVVTTNRGAKYRCPVAMFNSATKVS
jgi:hypothetical protein